MVLTRAQWVFGCAGVCLSAGWYLLYYRPVLVHKQTLTKHTAELDRRILSLHKRLARGTQKAETLSHLENQLTQKSERLSESFSQVSAFLLEHIHSHDVILKKWNPGTVKKHEYFFSQALVCEIVGSFSSLYDCIKNLSGSLVLRSAVFTKNESDILVSVLFLLFFRNAYEV